MKRGQFVLHKFDRPEGKHAKLVLGLRALYGSCSLATELIDEFNTKNGQRDKLSKRPGAKLDLSSEYNVNEDRLWAIKCTLEDLKGGFNPQVAVAMSDLHSAARHLRKVPKQEALEPPREAPVVVADHIPVPHVQGFADYLGWGRTIEERRAARQAFPWT